VFSRIINSPRPFTLPGRFDSLTSPLTYEPAGITTCPSIIIGNNVSKSTGSPGRALRVEMALCKTSGMCVPPGTSTLALVGIAPGARVLVGAGGAADVCDAADGCDVPYGGVLCAGA